MAGPTVRAMLKPRLFSATAAGMSSIGTCSRTEACQAGPLSAAPQPMRKVSRSSSQGVMSPAKATAASVAETANIRICAASMT